MRHHLGTVRSWCVAHWRLLGACAFYIPVSALLLFDLVLMLRRGLAASADGTWVISLAHDIIVGNPIGGWQLAKIALYFPDLVSVLFWRSMGLYPGTTMVLHGLVSWLLVGAGVCWGARLCGVGWLSSLRAALVGLFIYVLAYSDGQMLSTFQNPFTHGGAALGAFLGLVFIGHGLQNGYSRWSGALAAICLGSLVASDFVIVPQFIVPAGFTALLALAFRWASRRRAIATLVILTAGAALGSLITVVVRWLTGLTLTGLPIKYTWAAARLALARFVDDMGVVADRWPLAFTVELLSIALIVFVALKGAQQRFRRGGPSSPSLSQEGVAEWWVACSGLAVLGGTFSAVIASHMWAELANHRHILPLFLLPPALAIILLAPRLSGIPGDVARTLELSLVLATTLIVKQGAKMSPEYSPTLYTPGYACLDRYVSEQNLHAGASEYWKSRQAMVLSRVGLTVVEVDGRMRPRRWANNSFWYSRGYWGQERPPRYDFIVTSALDENWLNARFGAPRDQHGCFELKIWAYDRPSDLEFRNYLRTNIARETGDHEGWWESPTLAGGQASQRAPLAFEGKTGVRLEFPRVPANIIEVVCPTRRPLELTYRRAGNDIATQSVEFDKDPRRLVALPASLGSEGFDSVFVHGTPGKRHELEDLVLMHDPVAEAARALTATVSGAM
jgi:hypothetical protein